MPELPSIVVYCERLAALVGGSRLEKVRIASPFLLRSAVPPIGEAEGKRVREVSRLGKRIVVGLEDELYLVIHLMIAGRLRWRERGAAVPGRIGLAALDFPAGTLLYTEANKKRRASLHLVRGDEALAGFDRGGLEVLESPLEEFAAALGRENHTLKRALTDPRILSGIGNAYSDEILHRAAMSPFKQTGSLEDGEIERLYRAAREVLTEWIEILRAEVGEGFPDKVTAFHPKMAVHGRYREPCPRCGKPIQRIVYAENQANYCAECQTGGRLLADRALSRLLKKNWPRTLEELEEQETRRRPR
jgi:formamidopyrimidine-DNA glycosylase